ncbi:MAG: alanine racemase [Chloroflexi bacterium]|nr:alanine racemase [Chloroflexota bacterium]
MLSPRPTFAVVNLAAIQHNIRRMRQITGTRVMTVVKANGYGHGAEAVARAAVEAGADWLGVAFSAEGVALRHAGLTAPVLVLGYTPPHLAAEAIEHDLSLAVFDPDVARAYAEAARILHRRARLHVKVDTGMGRLGVPPAEAASLLNTVTHAGAAAEGIFTHFATADESDLSFAHEQLRRFNEALATVNAAGRPALVHAANSAAALHLPPARFDIVRVGIATYGLNPSPDAPVPPDFIPALEGKATVSQVKRLPPGAPVSYGREYFTAGHERIAVIPVGYADGFRRYPKNVAQVIIGGRRVPVVGRVCMDQIMASIGDASVSDAGDVHPGDEVVLIGAQGGARLTADDAAGWWGTINYDVTSGIMARVPRVYVRERPGQ